MEEGGLVGRRTRCVSQKRRRLETRFVRQELEAGKVFLGERSSETRTRTRPKSIDRPWWWKVEGYTLSVSRSGGAGEEPRAGQQ